MELSIVNLIAVILSDKDIYYFWIKSRSRGFYELKIGVLKGIFKV